MFSHTHTHNLAGSRLGGGGGLYFSAGSMHTKSPTPVWPPSLAGGIHAPPYVGVDPVRLCQCFPKVPAQIFFYMLVCLPKELL